jgi:cytochrome c oxidase subunit II
MRAGAGRACLLLGAVLVGLVALAAVGWAAEPHPWQLGMQQPATPVKERIHAFHNELLVIISLITVFVLGLLAYVMVRFSAKRHPVPTRTSHNPVIEILWTVVPVVILVLIAIPSFKLMYYMDRIPSADMTIKVTGHQWYWTYEYPDQGDLSIDSNLIQDKDLKPGQKRLLDVDNPLVVPVDTNVRVLVTSDPQGVIHSWYIPSFGVQEYAVPGRLNESWFKVLHEGIYYGECNQICGVNHAFMPIEIKAVSKDEFQKWVGQKKSAAAAPPSNGQAVMAVAGQPRPDSAPAGN